MALLENTLASNVSLHSIKGQAYQLRTHTRNILDYDQYSNLVYLQLLNAMLNPFYLIGHHEEDFAILD